MKFLLKKEVCRSIEQCTRPTGISQKLLKHVSQKKKRKKEKRNADTDAQENQSNPNGHILLEGIINFIQFI